MVENSVHFAKKWIASGIDFFSETPFTRTFTQEWLPTVDIPESKDSFNIKSELP